MVGNCTGRNVGVIMVKLSDKHLVRVNRNSSDTKMYYPLEKSLEECEAKIKAKPFSPCFDDQVKAARSLYGVQFAFWFSEADVDSLLIKAEAKNMYAEGILNRVGELVKQQINIWK